MGTTSGNAVNARLLLLLFLAVFSTVYQNLLAMTVFLVLLEVALIGVSA